MDDRTWNRRDPGRRARGAFTLMEVLLVLVILVVLGSLAVGMFTNTKRQADINAAKSQIELFATPLDLYFFAMNEYPSTAAGLEALRRPPADARQPEKWAGPYLDREIPLDPWGNPYQYAYPGTYNPDKYDIWSFGPDGQNGTADDIGNWQQ
jgi:general secretion pathway protein G